MIDQLIKRYPRVYHMAFADCRDSIWTHGLLSTQSLVELCELTGAKRDAILRQRRNELVSLAGPGGEIVIRDQKPISESKLAGCLDGGLTPQDWYQRLNERVFFWVRPDRVRGLLKAGAYAECRNDVYVFDTERLISDYADRIELAAMNTGATRPMAFRRGPSTFQKLATYPYEARRKKNLEPVIEFTVLGGLPNALEYVVEIERWDSGDCLEVIKPPFA